MEYLFSIYWKNYRVGLVYNKNNKYIFMYDNIGLNDASIEGFDKLIGFPDTNKIYISNEMFPIFSTRIKSYQRLKKDNENNINQLKNLINTEGKLVTDNIKIIKEDNIDHEKKHL